MSVGYQWNAWTVLGTQDTSVVNATGEEFGNINNEGKIATEVSVSVTYGAGAAAANVLVMRLVDGTIYENPLGAPWTVPMPAAASATRERTITLPGDMSGARIRIENNGAAALTATVRYRQATLGTT